MSVVLGRKDIIYLRTNARRSQLRIYDARLKSDFTFLRGNTAGFQDYLRGQGSFQIPIIMAQDRKETATIILLFNASKNSIFKAMEPGDTFQGNDLMFGKINKFDIFAFL